MQLSGVSKTGTHGTAVEHSRKSLVWMPGDLVCPTPTGHRCPSRLSVCPCDPMLVCVCVWKDCHQVVLLLELGLYSNRYLLRTSQRWRLCHETECWAS